MKKPESDYEWRQGFGVGFVAGMVAALMLVALALALTSCKLDLPANRSELPNTSTANHPESPDSSAVAAKVAAVMAAEGITLPMVAAYLYERGYTVHPSALPKWNWSAPTTGAPVAYYTFRMVGAVGDTSLVHYLPQAVGTYRLEVRGVSAAGAAGPWSEVGWSDARGAGGALPGVGE